MRLNIRNSKLNEMEKKLKDLLKLAYCPYSKFAVSAIVVTKDGKEFSGVNVENAAYSATVCAERVAILTAVCAGYRRGDFEALYCLDSSTSKNVSAACGECLQVLSEFFEVDKKCAFMNLAGSNIEFSMEEVLPYSFGVKDLEEFSETLNLKK